jgi:hypothetical protein
MAGYNSPTGAADTGGSFTGVLATVSSEQEFAIGGAGRVTFDETVYDTGGNFDTSAPNHDFIAPSDGYYRMTTQIRFGNPNGGSTLRFKLSVDGNTAARSSGKTPFGAFQGLILVKTMELAEGQRVAVDGENLNDFSKGFVQPTMTDSYLNIEKIG